MATVGCREDWGGVAAASPGMMRPAKLAGPSGRQPRVGAWWCGLSSGPQGRDGRSTLAVSCWLLSLSSFVRSQAKWYSTKIMLCSLLLSPFKKKTQLKRM
ncbi:hypothetical protein DAI22_12g100500 [Oryza sativa Japonica Group]|nr:hypothetical protein DAI22_12g100500 [Oryza sativa Japonica Group]